MRPDENDNRRPGTPLTPQRSLAHTPPSATQGGNSTPRQQTQAATEIIRGQINALYQRDAATQVSEQPQQTPQSRQAPQVQSIAPQPNTTQPNTAQSPPQPAAEKESIQQQSIDYKSPYYRNQVNPAQVQSDQWKQYHTAWQDYYQKYYERYYVGQVQHTKKALEERAAKASNGPQLQQQESTGAQNSVSSTEGVSSSRRDDAIRDLRNKLRDQIYTSAKKVRKSHHFVPFAAATGVMIIFLFLQFNRVLIANVQAYVSPGNVNSANVIIDPASELSIGDEPMLIIPKINVEVPVDYEATPDHSSQMKSMENGVAWFGIPGANSKPGQIGNTVISGHSSNDIIDQGQYKFVFARLDALSTGDNIYLNYEGKRYVYSVTRKETVKPTQVNKLIYETDKPVLTLITCTPLGTAINRLLITAEQISPSPTTAQAAPTQSTSDEAAVMPGNSPTFLERVFGGGDN